jgi:hypothetical protein
MHIACTERDGGRERGRECERDKEGEIKMGGLGGGDNSGTDAHSKKGKKTSISLIQKEKENTGIKEHRYVRFVHKFTANR